MEENVQVTSEDFLKLMQKNIAVAIELSTLTAFTTYRFFFVACVIDGTLFF